MRNKALPIMLTFFALCFGFSVFQGCGGGGGGGGGCFCVLNVSSGTVVDFFYHSGNIITLTSTNGAICYPPNDTPQPPTAPPTIDCQVPFRIRASGGAPVVNSGQSINLNSPCGSLTFTGLWGLDTTYGMPAVDYFNDRGRLFAYQTATDVGGDGSWLTVNVPDLSLCFSGTYTIRISNKRWDSGYYEVIDVVISCYGRDRVDADGDGWSSDEDCDDYDPNVNPGVWADCSGLYYDRNCNGISDWEECNPGGGGGCNAYGPTANINMPEIEPCY